MCPHPEKHWYASKARAKLALARHRKIRRSGLHAYRCECGGYHLGHKKAA